ncbi:FAD-dependent oxidoreductase [Streptomyces sp. NPDC014892]|uniref:flavin monoamine oxidase family protein n=1 Tax=Streptomyces sp. NPDC014892 TaxID=3364930 RepID=UPI0037021930
MTSSRALFHQTSADTAAPVLRQAMIGDIPPEAAGFAGTFRPPPPAKERARVAVLGAGIGGLTAAWQLLELGYDVTVLEAQERVGGRNRTARNGDELYELGDDGQPVLTHTCSFDDGLYLNLGPGRIPHHHRRVLRYCQELHVCLEPYVMETTANVVSTGDGTNFRWPNRRAANDTRGYLAEFVAHALRKDGKFTGGMRDLLRAFGKLNDKGDYKGSQRSGYLFDPEVDTWPQPARPIPFAELLKSRFWEAPFYQPLDYLWQATMFQPVGGMDKIAHALHEKIESKYGRVITLGAAVTQIDLSEKNKVTVQFETADGLNEVVADYCVSNIPLPVLEDIPADFSKDFRHAVQAVDFAETCKVGWQANARFWEDDKNEIYGGISWTNSLITQMWYPSNDYFDKHGTLTGAYNFGQNADKLGRMKPAERLAAARTGASRLHSEFKDRELVPDEQGITIAWHKVPYQLGGWAAWDPDNEEHMTAYRRLLQPDKQRFFVVGDQASPLPGWQEGAMMSAEYVVLQILGKMPLTVTEPVVVPDSVALTQGRPA